ncbi:hypothetical protein BGZ99_004872 [Dissophora globulifera]|uniref:Uncharacterized protein n=1 Tax=Dissophora globulifera TaxID=979702 RepID=A0A9P6RGV7_9FUNG|nr:hypothetical protein BGZ99_004872 [Dissophora globulifera]
MNSSIEDNPSPIGRGPIVLTSGSYREQKEAAILPTDQPRHLNTLNSPVITSNSLTEPDSHYLHMNVNMTKSTPPQSPAVPGMSVSKTNSGSPGITKKFPLSFFSSKKPADSSKDGQDHTLSMALIAAAMPGLTLATGVPMAKPSLTPALSVQIIISISLDIFPTNIPQRECGILLPEISERIEDTSQLVFCRNLLAKGTADAAAASLSLLSSPSFPSTLNPAQLAWTQEMESHPLEKDHLRQLMDRMINKFIQHPSKDSETICEIVLLAPVLDEKQYRSLLNCFLAEFQRDTLLNIELLQGLVQLIQDASIGFLKEDDLTQILRIIRTRQQNQKLDVYLFHLTLAISKVLDAMVDEKVTGLDRVKEHEPLLKMLSGLRRREDPFLKYQALYAFQALQWVPDDETKRQCGLRHLTGVVEGLIKISGVVQLDFRGFLGGLQDIQKALESTYDILKTGWENVPTSIEHGKGIFDSVKEGLGSSRRHPWYIALRGAEALVRNGQLSDFNKLVSTTPYLQEPVFQWGICQLLGEIAVYPMWEQNTRSQAIMFLAEMYRSIAGSKQQRELQRWILTILQQVSILPDFDSYSATNSLLKADNESVRTQAQALLDDLEKDEIEPFQYPYLLHGRLPFPRSSLLLKDVNDNPDLELVMDRLRRQQWNRYNKQAVYVQPLSKASLQATEDNLIPLHTRVHDFLESKAEVMVILGDSGAGKSTFNRYLEYDLWEKYKPGSSIPLFVDLKTINNPDQDMVKRSLEGLGVFSRQQMDELKRSRQFILICDGYDERGKWTNLHTNNSFNKPSHWKAKLIITCRTQYLSPIYLSYLQPSMDGCSVSYNLYEEAVIVPFKAEQIKDYINQYIAAPEPRESFDSQPLWTTEMYIERLQEVTGLMDLVKNPFMLRMVLSTLPGMTLSKTHLSRVELYDKFVELHFKNEQKRLVEQSSSGNIEADYLSAFREIEGDSFIILGIAFSKRLSDAIFMRNKGVNSIGYLAAMDRGTWKTEFFGLDAEVSLLRGSCQLVRQANDRDFDQFSNKSQTASKKHSFGFSHRSILEYFYSRLIYDPQGNPSQFGLSACLVSTTIPSQTFTHPLGQRNIVSEPSIIHFLAERAQQNEEFKNQLHDIIHLSKTDHQVSQAAANAITILIRAGIRFNGADLNGIQIPGADLSNGQFDFAQLQGANLRNTTLHNTWLRQANLSNSQMEGIDFGEQPYLTEKSADAQTGAPGPILRDHSENVFSVVYSPSGHQIASGSEDKTVRLWDPQTGAPGLILGGHSSAVMSVVYSPSGQQIASSSDDKTVRLWDARNGAPGLILSGHSKTILSVVFSPGGQQIASGSKDNTVRLWDAQTGAPGLTLGFNLAVSSVVYSPCGRQIASGSWDKTVRLWDVQTGAPGLIFNGHSGAVVSVVYSPGGQQIASGSMDGTLRLWDAQTVTPSPILSSHSGTVFSVVYSPSGQQIASGSGDKTVRLWDAETGAPGPILSGHSDNVRSIVYSPSGQQIASGSWDKTVRLWDAQTGAPGLILGGHSSAVMSVVFSPSGQQIASSSDDKTVRLWDAETGAPGLILGGHSSTVSSVVYSPSGQQIASGSKDKTVRLWDVQTGAPGLIFSGHSGVVISVVYSPSGHQIASGSWDKTVRLWDAQTGAPGLILGGHSSAVMSVVFSPSGQQIASSSDDKTVRLWDAETGAPGLILGGHSSTVSSVVYSPSGQQIASGSKDKTVRLWDVQTGAPGLIFSGHSGVVISVVYSPSGHQIASGSWDKTVRLWDAQTGAPGLIFNGHSGAVVSVVYSPGGQQIASGSTDSAVRLWDVESGGCLAVVECKA